MKEGPRPMSSNKAELYRKRTDQFFGDKARKESPHRSFGDKLLGKNKPVNPIDLLHEQALGDNTYQRDSDVDRFLEDVEKNTKHAEFVKMYRAAKKLYEHYKGNPLKDPHNIGPEETYGYPQRTFPRPNTIRSKQMLVDGAGLEEALNKIDPSVSFQDIEDFFNIFPMGMNYEVEIFGLKSVESAFSSYVSKLEKEVE